MLDSKCVSISIAFIVGAARIAQAGVSLSASPSPATFGAPVTLTATMTPSGATGKVTFYDGAVVLGTASVSGGTATLRIPLNSTGPRSLFARYLGDSNNSPGVSPVVVETVKSMPSFGFIPTNISVNGSVQDFAVADFNGDGKADVAVAPFGNSISVVLGNGNGTFGAPILTFGSVNGQFASIVAADFNGDGKIDVALGTTSPETLVVYLGNGDGTFGGPTSYPVALGSMVVADFNLDGIPDIVVVNSNAQTFTILLGKGDGTFGTPKSYGAGGIPSAVAVGDLNGDGKPDLVSIVPTADTLGSLIVVLLGNGDGSFAAVKSYVLFAALGYEEFDSAFLLADLDGDGKLDLAIAAAPNHGIWVCKGNGDGTFAGPAQFNAGLQDQGAGVGIAAADVDGDGSVDVVADTVLSTFLGAGLGNELQTYYGNGDGTFRPVEILAAPQTHLLYKLVAADFNGDGRVDLMTWGYDGNNNNLILKLFSGGVTPELKVSTTHTGNPTPGQTQVMFTVVVSNTSGASATSGVVTVNYGLNGFMNPDSITGAGWTCNNSSFATCTRSDVLGAGASYPPITITADVQSTAPTITTSNDAIVSGGGSEIVEAYDIVTIVAPAGCNYSLSSQSLSAGANATSGSVTVITSPGCAWVASSNNSWLTISSGASGSVTGPVNFQILANPVSQPRTGTLTIAGLTFTVTQAASAQSTIVPTAVLRDPFGAIRLSTFASSTLNNSGGAFASDPSSAQDGAGFTYVTARDTYNAIWANVYVSANGGGWTGWRFGGAVIQGIPSIAVDPTATAWIASRDNYNSYWLINFTPRQAGFGSWTHLAGVFATDPVVTACSDGSLYVVGKDNYNALWSGHYLPGTGFQGFVLGGGVVQGKPSVSCGTDNAAYIVARDNYNSNWIARVSGNTWTGWFNGGAVTSIDPRIAALGGRLAIVILDGTGAVYQATFNEGSGNGWQGWTNIGGVLSDIAPAAVGGELFFAGRAPNNDLWWWRQTGNQWTWIGNNGVAAGALSSAPR